MAQFESAQNIDANSQRYKNVVALEMYIAGEGGIPGALKRHNINVLAVPTATDISMSFASIAGSPAVTVPLGFMPSNTPVEKDSESSLIASGPNMPYVYSLASTFENKAILTSNRFPICFYAKRYDEQTLIRVAYAFGQLTGVRNNVQPYKLPKTELHSSYVDGSAQVKVGHPTLPTSGLVGSLKERYTFPASRY